MTRELFADLHPIDEVHLLLNEHFPKPPDALQSEVIPLDDAECRTLAEDVRAPHSLPGFRRSSVDGYAVKAEDTRGAGESLPAVFELQPNITMGRVPETDLKAGQAAYVPTGGMLSEGADAVVMIEHTMQSVGGKIEIVRQVAPGENVIRADEDAASGEKIFSRLTHLRPAHLGVLSGLGIRRVEVLQRLQVAVFSSGDEILPPSKERQPAKVHDMNGPMLTASVRKDGMAPTYCGILPDSGEKVLEEVTTARKKHHAVIISGGSSVGLRDITADVIDHQGPPGVLLHGVALKPGKPTILGRAEDDTLLVGLPGHPVSAQVVYFVLLRDLLRRMAGRCFIDTRPTVSAVLTRSLAAPTGRREYVRVSLQQEDGQLSAEPILGKSGLLTGLAAADGLVQLDEDRSGADAGDAVEVIVFDR